MMAIKRTSKMVGKTISGAHHRCKNSELTAGTHPDVKECPPPIERVPLLQLIAGHVLTIPSPELKVTLGRVMVSMPFLSMVAGCEDQREGGEERD